MSVAANITFEGYLVNHIAILIENYHGRITTRERDARGLIHWTVVFGNPEWQTQFNEEFKALLDGRRHRGERDTINISQDAYEEYMRARANPSPQDFTPEEQAQIREDEYYGTSDEVEETSNELNRRMRRSPRDNRSRTNWKKLRTRFGSEPNR